MSSDDEKAPLEAEQAEITSPAAPAPSIRESETVTPIDSPIGSQAAEVEDDDDESVGYEESAERDEIIRERINRTQESMR